MIFVLLEPADDQIGKAPIVTQNGKPLSDAKRERKLRRIASSSQQRFKEKHLTIRIQKSSLWLVCFVLVNPIDSKSRPGQCVIGIRRTPWTWVQRKLHLLDTAITQPIIEAGFQVDNRVNEALLAISKGRVNENYTTA